MNNVFLVVPSIALGAFVPAILMVLMIFSKNRSKVSFNSFWHGLASFFFTIIAVLVLFLMFGRVLVPSINVTEEADANVYIYVGAAIILALFWLVSEALKLFSFTTALKSERNMFAGTAFGCGFVLAQNLLVFGLVFLGEFDLSQSLGFGVLMLLTGLIYLLVSTIAYRLVTEQHRFAGGAIAVLYFLMFMVMVLFSNVYVTYTFFAMVLIFMLVVAYITLPLPFKKERRE